MTDLHAIAARPRPRIKRIEITDPTLSLAVQVERLLLDTSRNKDTRIRDVLTLCREKRRARP
jgi:hypothetical protein